MRRQQISQQLRAIANLLEIDGANRFRTAAYRKAADTVASAPVDLQQRIEEGTLTGLDGIGEKLAATITQLATSGTCDELDQLSERYPQALTDLLAVQGLGPKTVKKIYESLGISSLEGLAEAARNQRLRTLSGLGPKTEQSVLDFLENVEARAHRMLLGEAQPLADQLQAYLQAEIQPRKLTYAGSLRRGKETVGDLDFLAVLEPGVDPRKASQVLASMPGVDDVLAQGNTKTSVRLSTGTQVDLRVVEEDSFASALHYFTGSKEHNVRMRERAIRQGLKLNEYGLLRLDDDGQEIERLNAPTEKAIFEALGLAYIDPELREDQGEIEAAASGQLPDLVQASDLRGDLHVHSNWSDGDLSLLEVAQAAVDQGLEYLALTDHSKALAITGGLDEKRLAEQRQALEDVRQQVPDLTILHGLEVDILADASLDLNQEWLAKLDIVVASIHQRHGQGREQLTRRILAALDSPHVDIVGHLTGRLIGRRPPCDLDLETIFERAAATNTVLEINSSPDRLDVSAGLARRAREHGVRFAVNTDAHHQGELANSRYGVLTARRAWLTADDVINTWSLEKLRDWLNR